MKKVLLNFLFLMMLSPQLSAAQKAGDFEGNGGDGIRLMYSIYYHSKIQNDFRAFTKLPRPSTVKTHVYYSDNDVVENILFELGLEGTLFASSLKESINCLRQKIAMNTSLYQNISDLNHDFKSISRLVIDTLKLSQEQSERIYLTQVNITTGDLFDKFGARVCALANKRNYTVFFNNECLAQENSFTIKILMIHEILRVLEFSDDEYQNTYEVLKKGFSFFPLAVNRCLL